MPDALPTTRITGGGIYWEKIARRFQSPESGNTQTLDVFGRWQGVFQYDGLEEDEKLPLLAFTDKVGLSTPFTALHPTQRQPRAVWAYGSFSPTVNGGGQTGTSLITAGWPSNTLILKAGDFVELATGQVVRISADITSSGTAATLQFGQLIRTSPTHGSAITVVNPKFTMVLNKMPEDASMRPPALSSFQLEMREDI